MAAPLFRETFSYANKEVLNWFPGHMAKGLRIMQAKLRTVDGIIEVHDARIPLSGRNALFATKLSMVRPHLMILNKIDLADLSRRTEIEDRLLSEGITNVMFTDCLHADNKAVHEVVPRVVKMMENSPRYDRSVTSPSSFTLMVIGVPNVGKSSLINALRRIHLKRDNKATPIGAMPGVTKSVHQGIKISLLPKIQVLDTPGVAQPNIKNVTTGLKLALCHILHDYMVGEDVIVDYLLFWMNRMRDFRYVETLSLDAPTDNVHELLCKVAVNKNMFVSVRSPTGGPSIERPDFHLACLHVLTLFRTGKMGKFMLDDDCL